MVAADRRRDTPRHGERCGGAANRSRPCRAPASGRARSPSTRTARRSATASCGWTVGAAPHSRRAVGGPVAGYAPLALWRWVRRTGGAPSTSGADPIGHMLHLEHDEPDVPRNGALVPGAGRLPVDAVHGRRRRLARVDDRGVADRQPPAWTASTTTRCWSGALGGAGRQAAARWCPPARSWATVRAEVADALGLPARASWSSPGRPTSTPPRSARGRSSTTRPTSRSARPRGSAAPCR